MVSWTSDSNYFPVSWTLNSPDHLVSRTPDAHYFAFVVTSRCPGHRTVVKGTLAWDFWTFQPLGNETQRLQKWSSDYPIFLALNHKPMHVQIDHNWILNEYFVLKVVYLFVKLILWVTRSRYCYTSKYCYPEVGKCSGDYTRIFSTSEYHNQEVVVSLLLSLTIAGYPYPEVDQFLSNNTWKLTIEQFPGNDTRKLTNLQHPGNNTRKLPKRQKC